ncbi:SDR family NAD(P)-dependent oxidoreductase [Halococcus salifodinae]|uniref:3-oxoacyl-ACP reductase n=1 Tax=Halococcus salifodinae DSM 8989 TaxID=1227456 RepID=M0NA14_9EURY|nr:SDR family NAD(P)-dependent oxidoreductase [Halococcus salifodinae]EMA54413.1 3-oxoacyl-ACP reductase [Halococcus salifodinae DSM 8989]
MAESRNHVTVDGKRAVVIGGTSGIGRAIAVGFAADGADVVASSRTESAVAETAEELQSAGAETVVQPCDVTDRESLVALRDQVVEELGGVDVLVTSQSAIARDPIASVSENDWATVLDVQLSGVHRACQVFAPAMDDGSVVTVSSMGATLAMPETGAYSAAKGGTDAYTRVAAKELGPEVRVNAIRPGFILTPQTAEAYGEGTDRRREVERKTEPGRMGQPEELVGAAIYLASDAASYTTGEVLTVDGGFSNTAFEA